ncbi:alpha/beta fold hydrolase [Actinoplanes sp. NPDC051851]|uniref:alpha/beta hydrolase n=1 Tax=Actinoplanes sp. NPDC051851 TaxID=3154753 RepID=UPI0034371836
MPEPATGELGDDESDFGAAIRAAEAVIAAETADPAVRPEGRSRLLSHGSRTERSVLLLHGYTHAPVQFDALAAAFFDRGYNVWIPRAPGHGTADPDAHHRVTAAALTRYADTAMTVAAGLGDEAGVVGISGGAVLAAWLAQTRGDTVRDLLLLSPFFAPDAARAPRALIRPMIALYGRGLLPERRTARGYSMRAAAQYLRVAARLRRPRPTGLRRVAVAISARDGVVDPVAAIGVPRRLADAAGIPLGVLTLPESMGIGHDTLRLGDSAAAVHADYLALYENSGEPWRAADVLRA